MFNDDDDDDVVTVVVTDTGVIVRLTIVAVVEFMDKTSPSFSTILLLSSSLVIILYDSISSGNVGIFTTGVGVGEWYNIGCGVGANNVDNGLFLGCFFCFEGSAEVVDVVSVVVVVFVSIEQVS